MHLHSITFSSIGHTSSNRNFHFIEKPLLMVTSTEREMIMLSPKCGLSWLFCPGFDHLKVFCLMMFTSSWQEDKTKQDTDRPRKQHEWSSHSGNSVLLEDFCRKIFNLLITSWKKAGKTQEKKQNSPMLLEKKIKSESFLIFSPNTELDSCF